VIQVTANDPSDRKSYFTEKVQVTQTKQQYHEMILIPKCTA